MSASAVAQAMVGAQASSTQMSLAAIMLKMNASAASGVADMLEKASQNLTSLANVAPGVGQSVNISA
jgi:hypothetical protein